MSILEIHFAPNLVSFAQNASGRVLSASADEPGIRAKLTDTIPTREMTLGHADEAIVEFELVAFEGVTDGR